MDVFGIYFWELIASIAVMAVAALCHFVGIDEVANKLALVGVLGTLAFAVILPCHCFVAQHITTISDIINMRP